MNDLVKSELERIQAKHNGFLRPQDVVDAARSSKSPLHEYFEWNDSEAAQRYRLAQARALIRVAVVVEPTTAESVRAFVSLSSDRNAAGGYRALAQVLSDEVMKETLLADALRDLTAFQRKYDALKAVTRLNRLFASIDDVVRAEVSQSAA